ncbi:MAG TPA: VWA domain-containing protein, partial [Acidobacteriota bacterium]|nr:VWA domain-containing protein [Acidobacteriota bacterium]
MFRGALMGIAVRLALQGALLLSPALCFPQSVHENVNVDLVNVYVTATDSKGHFITDLKPSEIELTEDGVRQEITHFTNFAQDDPGRIGEKGVPLTVAFVIDTSSSMGDTISGQVKIDIVRSAALRLADELREEDRMMLVAFNEYPDEVTPLTADHKRFDQDLLFQSVKDSNTALLDSIYFAMDKMKDVWGRKIIVVCSDGEDTASYLKFDEVMSNLVASDITVLAFGTMALNSNSMRGRYILEKLATASGGYAFFPTSLKMLDQVMAQLREGMRSQYSLGYRPARDPEPGSWHKISVKSL